MLIVIRAIISSCFGCGNGRRNGWLERRWIFGFWLEVEGVEYLTTHGY